jgi:hypothetical protein
MPEPHSLLGALQYADSFFRGVLARPGIYAGAALLPNRSGAWARILATDAAALRAALVFGLGGRVPAVDRRCASGEKEMIHESA